MMSASFERKWLIARASEVASARDWLRRHLADGAWRLDLVGLEDDGAAPGGARIAVRCVFKSEADADAFANGYLARHAAAPALPPKVEPECEADAAFSDSARRILEGPGPVSAGKLHFVGLDQVRARFGDAWPKLASRAEALVRRAIERRLSPLDVYRKTADLNFVIVFGSLSGREAELKCALITEEITRMLVGEDMGSGLLAAKTDATEVNGPETLGKLGPSLDIAQVIEAEIDAERMQREAAAGEKTAAAARDPLDDVKFVYRPIWDVKRSAVANYFLMPDNDVGAGRPRYGDSELPGLENIDARRRFDELVVKRVVADLEALQRQGRRLVISFPIHFESISTPTRRGSLLGPWRALPAETRKLGVCEIVGAPDGVPQGRVAEIVNHLRVETRGVLMRVPLTSPSLRNFADTGILAIGAELGTGIATEERLMGAFRDFVAVAERARLVTYIHGLRSFSLTVGAIGAGFAYVDGDPVSSISDRPEEAYRFGLEDLYAQRLQG